MNTTTRPEQATQRKTVLRKISTRFHTIVTDDALGEISCDFAPLGCKRVAEFVYLDHIVCADHLGGVMRQKA